MKSGSWKTFMAVVAVLMIMLSIAGIMVGSCGGTLETTTGATVWMKCHWTSRVVCMLGIMGAVAAVIGMFAKSAEGRLMALVPVALMPIASMLVEAVVIGVCNGDAMLCHMGRIGAVVISAAVLILCVVLAVKRDPDKADRPRRTL